MGNSVKILVNKNLGRTSLWYWGSFLFIVVWYCCRISFQSVLIIKKERCCWIQMRWNCKVWQMSCELTLETCFSFAFLGLHWHKIGKNVAWVHVLHILHTNKALLERTELLNYLFVFFYYYYAWKKRCINFV